MWIVNWAKPLKLWHIGLCLLVLAGRLGAPYLGEAQQRVPATWVVPPYAQLKYAVGTLEFPFWEVPRGRGQIRDWGQLRLDDGTIFGFTCKPGIGEMNCAYFAPFQRDQNVGKRFQLRYFEWPNKQGPSHVIMELRGTGQYAQDVVLGYDGSKDRVEKYRSEAKRPSFLEVCFWGFLILSAPGLIYRLATGREEPPPKNEPAKRIELSSL